MGCFFLCKKQGGGSKIDRETKNGGVDPLEVDQQVDIWKETIQKDIETIKAEQVNMKDDIRRLQDKELMQDQQIDSIKEDLKEIKDDTKWLRHAITNALIVAIIGGAVAIFYAAIQ